MRRIVIAILAAACAKSAPQVPADVQAHVALQKAASCDALEKSVQDAAVREMRADIDAYKDSSSPGPVMMGGAAGAPQAAAAAPASYSTTNVQVAGVDEADFVKNDGTRIFMLTGQSLYAARSWPPQSLAFAGKLDIEGWPTEMFLDGDRLVIFSGIWSGGTGGMMVACPLSSGGMGCFGGYGTTKVTVVDMSDLAAPKVTSELYLPGSANGARRVGDSVRLVLTDQVRWPDGIKWWPDYDATLYQNHDLLVAALNKVEDDDEAIIRSTPLSKWFPDGQRKDPDGTTVDVSYQCSDFYLSNAPERLGLVTIATLDLSGDTPSVSRASIVGESGILYATQSHLYIASEHWWWWPWSGQRDYTYLHEFDISDPASAGYVGSGGVEGHLGDQFAMDEKDGYLRVASSTSAPSSDPSAVHGMVVGSRLTVLAPTDGELVKVGEIPSLEDAEQLTAMRFVGDMGFAVTFRAVDPLVTLDLTDPAHPKKVAELTIPGFSTYLQPIDPTHLLAIGEDETVDAHGVPDWSHRSMQLSLFDVSDLSNPQRAANVLVGSAWASSEAEWDHHAFNWFNGFLAIPFSDWGGAGGWSDFVSDVRVFAVDPGSAEKISAIGALGMADVYVQEGDADWTWYYRPWVRRSVMATDDAGTTYVYAVSDAGIRVAALNALGTPIATALISSAPAAK